MVVGEVDDGECGVGEVEKLVGVYDSAAGDDVAAAAVGFDKRPQLGDHLGPLVAGDFVQAVEQKQEPAGFKATGEKNRRF